MVQRSAFPAARDKTLCPTTSVAALKKAADSDSTCPARGILLEVLPPSNQVGDLPLLTNSENEAAHEKRRHARPTD